MKNECLTIYRKSSVTTIELTNWCVTPIIDRQFKYFSLSWVVAIWIELARFIGEKGAKYKNEI